ncbi:hypothetical protein [Thalassotalea sp. LPB0316]|nr:hypothetical protein [Thalassotalea sp. LPB0316]
MSKQKNGFWAHIPAKEKPGLVTLLCIVAIICLFGLGVQLGSLLA